MKVSFAEQQAVLQHMQSKFFTTTGTAAEQGCGVHRLNVTPKENKAKQSFK